MLMGAIGLVIAVNFATTPAIAILGLTIATMGALTGLPMFWPVPTAMLSAGAAAGGLALINSMGQMAGFLSPYIVGFCEGCHWVHGCGVVPAGGGDCGWECAGFEDDAYAQGLTSTGRRRCSWKA